MVRRDAKKRDAPKTLRQELLDRKSILVVAKHNYIGRIERQIVVRLNAPGKILDMVVANYDDCVSNRLSRRIRDCAPKITAIGLDRACPVVFVR